MTTNQPIVNPITPTDEKWNNFIQLYESAFPEVERRTESALITMTGNRLMSLNTIDIDHLFAGLFNYWSLGHFFYIEHFAIVPYKRNMGIGTEVLQNFLKNKIVVLECELPTDDLSKRRILFYQSLGFHVFPFSYSQPPYSSDKPAVPMLLLTNFTDLSEHSFIEISSTIAQSVYQQSTQL
jgi:ribosomal protein S18 acetylase RimI-like enzyme